MARGNTVELTFAGDTQSLERSFAKVSQGSKTIEMDIKKSSGGIKEGFDRIGDGADTGEQRIVGLRDAITGTGDVMRGFKEGDITLLLTGFADLASSIANFAGPILGSLLSKLGLTTLATKVQAVAQGALNAVMAANPIFLVVAALVALTAGFVIAYKKSETFRNIVQGAMSGVRTAIGWVVARFGDLWNFVKDLPGRIKNALGGLKDILTAPFSGAFNAIKDFWNNTLGGKGFNVTIPDILGVPHRGETIGFTLPKFHTGGVVPGAPGTEVPIMAMAGERVVPQGQGAGLGGVTVIVQGNVLDGTQLADLVQTALLQKQRRTGSLGFAA